MKKIVSSKTFLSFIIPLIIATSFLLPRILKNDGQLFIYADFNYQQIPFSILANDLIKEGNINYNWYNDLGSSFIGSFSFYNIGSPFFWITLLFPGKFFTYLAGPILILKFAIAGLFSFLYLKRYCKNKNYALIGSLLYTFSGFQITNILFYHFHDAVALFPLLLIGLDKLFYDNKKRFILFCSLYLCSNQLFLFRRRSNIFSYLYFN